MAMTQIPSRTSNLPRSAERRAGFYVLIICIWLLCAARGWGQTSAELTAPTSGGAVKIEEAPIIQDNSFLVEEAYNQEFGVVQHIQTFQRVWSTHSWGYTFTQECP